MDSDEEPRASIEDLEARIEQLAATIESCRKFILASRVALVLGGATLAALVFGLIAFDPAVFAGATAAVLGGFVLLGSNGSTQQQAQEEMQAAEAERAALIGHIELQVVRERPTLH